MFYLCTMKFNLEDTNEFISWLSDTRDHISQIMSKLAAKENFSEKDELFLEQQHSFFDKL